MIVSKLMYPDSMQCQQNGKMPNLTNLMVRWKTAKDRPSKGGYSAMVVRLDQFKGLEWNNNNAAKLFEFCKDFQINHPYVNDVAKCALLFNDINKF